MLAGRDSAFAPNDEQLAAFYAQGVRVWGLYIKLGNDGIYHGSAEADFARIRAHGMVDIAYMSGWDDPTQARAVANSWGVSIVIVDIEAGIRPDGTWVQGWLNTADAGEYGNLPVHHYTATIHEDAGYFGYDPKATWPSGVPRPAGICGWQWQGSHTENGLTVDSAWWDDAIAGGQFGTPSNLRTEAVRMAAILVNADSPNKDAYLDSASGKRHISLGEFQGLRAAGVPVQEVSGTVIAAIPDAPTSTASAAAVNMQPVLDAIAALKGDVDVIKARVDKDLA